MALGTKEDGRIIIYSQAIIQSKLEVREFASLDKNLKFVSSQVWTIRIILLQQALGIQGKENLIRFAVYSRGVK